MALAATTSLLPHSIFLFLLLWLTWKLRNFLRPRNDHSLRSVAIVVLGDIGRSPRMMYHAQSFAENDFVTNIIGYGGSKPIPALERLPRIQLHYLPEPPKMLQALPFAALAPIKIVHQTLCILFILLVQIAKPPEFIVVQNPPTIPTLALVWLVGRIRGSKVIIDWHNLGYTILALKLGDKHPFVRIATWFEATFGRSAYAHLFVTQAMRDFLVREWDLQGKKIVLHDRPPHHFHRCSPQETHELFQRLQPSLAVQPSLRDFLPDSSMPYSTPFTHTTSSPSVVLPDVATMPRSSHDALASRSKKSNPIAQPVVANAPTYTEVSPPSERSDRPGLLVSSTSWTPDEDFGLLLEAMGTYERRARELSTMKGGTGRLPKLMVVLTGKGPLRERYMMEVKKLQEKWEWVRCISLWLEAEDYPLLLGSADLGVCLHSSSSALDLPMKVVDMFGCGLPVCALDFKCLHELVKDGLNGLVFSNASQLAEQLEALFTSFPESPRLKALRSSLSTSSQRHSTPPHIHSSHDYDIQNEDSATWHWGTWEENWGHKIRPLILSDLDL